MSDTNSDISARTRVIGRQEYVNLQLTGHERKNYLFELTTYLFSNDLAMIWTVCFLRIKANSPYLTATLSIVLPFGPYRVTLRLI